MDLTALRIRKFIDFIRRIEPNFLKGKDLAELISKSTLALNFEIVEFSKKDKSGKRNQEKLRVEKFNQNSVFVGF